MKGLVYHAGALGDFITALPSIAVWSRLRRGGPLVLLGRPAHAELAPELFAEAWDASSREFSPLLGGSAASSASGAAGRLAAVSDALVFAPAGAPIVGAFEAAGVTRLVRQDPFPPGGVHVVDWHLALFSGLALPESDRIPRIHRPAVSRRGSAPVVIAPGSGSARKNWPLDRFVALARGLAASGAPGERIAWVTGPAEEEAAVPPRIAAARPGDDVWSGVGLAELADRLAEARLLVGNDSGVTHLAAAVGCPVLALFGATDPGSWAPRGGNVRVLGDGMSGMEAIRVAEVLASAQEMLSILRAAGGATGIIGPDGLREGS